jgi:integrase
LCSKPARGWRGGQQSHQHLEKQYADLVLSNPLAAERVAELIRQSHRVVPALRVVKLVGRMAGTGPPEPTRFHDLRHSCATLLIQQGVHLRVVMEILGRSSIALRAGAKRHHDARRAVPG